MSCTDTTTEEPHDRSALRTALAALRWNAIVALARLMDDPDADCETRRKAATTVLTLDTNRVELAITVRTSATATAPQPAQPTQPVQADTHTKPTARTYHIMRDVRARESPEQHVGALPWFADAFTRRSVMRPCVADLWTPQTLRRGGLVRDG